VRKALATLPWVRKVEVSFGKKQAVVTAVASSYDERALLEALKKAGYGGKVVKKS
jgi:hypothetical protein